MSSFPLFAEFDFPGGPGGLATLVVVLVLMACLGVFALLLYGLWTMRGRNSRESDRPPPSEQAVGRQATVYVTIPGRQNGSGKIQMNLQNRTIELPAMTSGEKLPPGAKVEVVGVITPTTVEVQPMPDPERSNNV